MAGLLPGSPVSSIFIAEYAEDAVSGTASATCTIPSAQFLQAAVGLSVPAPGSLSVELSNDGSVFSTAGLEVQFLPTDQVRGIDPANGPETGATVIDVTLDTLPIVNSAIPKAACEFPGGEKVAAVFISPTLIQCTAPPLAPAAQGVVATSSISWAPVTVSQGGRRLGHFVFAYTRGVKVSATEPPDTVPPEGANPAALTLLVIGSGFLPTRVTGLRCLLQEGLTEFGTPAAGSPSSGAAQASGVQHKSYQVEAIYVRNGTLSCEVPGSVLQSAWTAREAGATQTILGVEVSLNGGQ